MDTPDLNKPFPLFPVRYRTKSGNAGPTQAWTVPVNERWHVISVPMTYVASATVGNRAPRLNILDAFGNTIEFLFAGTVTATQTKYWFAIPNLAFVDLTSTTNQVYPLPEDLILEPGWTVQYLDGGAIDAADQITLGISYREEALR